MAGASPLGVMRRRLSGFLAADARNPGGITQDFYRTGPTDAHAPLIDFLTECGDPILDIPSQGWDSSNYRGRW